VRCLHRVKLLKATVELPVVACYAATENSGVSGECRGNPGGMLLKVENTHAGHPFMKLCNHPRIFTVEVGEALDDFTCSVTE